MEIEYSLQAKERIEKANYLDFKEFLQPLQADKLENILKKLPKVNGFRQGKDTEIRLKLYFGRCSSWDDKDWSLLLNIWLMNTESQTPLKGALGFQNNEETEKIIGKLIKSPKMRQEVVGKIVESAQTEQITQKAIKNWMFFSPLPNDDKLERLISFVPKENTVNLKTRVEDVEKLIKALVNKTVQQSQLQTTYKRVEKLSNELTIYFDRLAEGEKGLQETFNHINKVESIQNSFIKKFESQNKENKSLASSLKTVLARINILQEELKEIQKRVKQDALLSGYQDNQIESIKENYSQLNEKLDVLLQDIELFKIPQEEYKEIQKRTNQGALLLEYQVTEVKSLRNDYLQLNEKLDALAHDMKEIRLLKPATTNSNTHNTSQSQWAKGIEIIQRHHFVEDGLVDLRSCQDVVAHLEKNLKLLGIKIPHARRLAREILAATFSGQLVSLQGSLAYLVAERCAACLAGGEFKVIKIPVGCVDPYSLEEIITALIEETDKSSHPKAIILEGINRSAFESYGESIKQFIIERIFQIRPDNHNSLLFFATVVEGPSTLPVGPEILEIGPLIFVDAIKWLDKPSTDGIGGLIDKEAFKRDSTNPSLDEHDWDESLIPEWLYILAGPLWRRALLMADFSGREMDPSLETLFEFALFGWILPMAICLNSSNLGDFAEYIENDERLRFLLIKYNPEVVDFNEMELHR